MFNILLVDDERGIAEGVQFIIESAGRDWKIIGIAEDGEEGLELAQKHRPDIVITDVCMPVMDGLDMIKHLNKTQSHNQVQMKYIMLSGYSEFEYARQAISLGVRFYVTKPVDEDELYDVLTKVCDEIDKERNLACQMASLEQTIQNFEEDRKEQILRRILEGLEEKNMVMDELEDLSFPTAAGWVYCILWEFHGDLEIQHTGELMSRIKAALGEYAYVELVRCSNVRIVIIIADHDKPDQQMLIQQVMAAKTEEEQNLDMPISVGIGEAYEEPWRLEESFREADQALSNRVIRGMGSVICYSELAKKENSFAIREEEIQQLEGYLNSGDTAGCRSMVHRLFKRFSGQPGMTILDLQMQSLNIILSGLRTMPVMQFQLNEFLGKNILTLESISRFQTLEQIENWINNILAGIIEIKKGMLSDKKQDLMTQIKEYIKENYTKDISLNEIARSFYLSPYYLSQLFKKKTGLTYQNYITSLRIDKAKQMLWENGYKVYEISEMVGYKDTAYFSRVFKKMTGLWPSEYKNKMDAGEIEHE